MTDPRGSSAMAGSGEGVPARLTLLATFGLLVGPLVSMVDSSIVNIAVPVLARDLHTDLSTVHWAVSGYLLAMGAALSASAYLAKRLGTRVAYTASLAGFTLSSLLCSIAPSIEVLIGARVLQGLAGAALLPVAMSMLMGGRSEETRRQIPALVGVVLLAAPALGPTVGGALIVAFGWPSIFLVNAPLGVLGILAVLRLGEQVTTPADPSARFDPFGMTMLGTGMATGLYGLANGQQQGWLAGSVWPFWALGLGLLAGYLVWASRVEHPAVDLGLVRGAQPALGLAVVVLATVVLGAVLFLIPVYLQAIQGFSTLQTGLVLLPQDVVMAAAMVLANRLVGLGRTRPTVAGGAVLLTATTALLLTLTSSTPAWLVALILSGRGLALALIVQPLLDALMARVAQAKLADANTLFNVVQRLAGSFAIALLATFLEQQAVRAGLLRAFMAAVAVLVALSAGTVMLALLFRPAAIEESRAWPGGRAIQATVES